VLSSTWPCLAKVLVAGCSLHVGRRPGQGDDFAKDDLYLWIVALFVHKRNGIPRGDKGNLNRRNCLFPADVARGWQALEYSSPDMFGVLSLPADDRNNAPVEAGVLSLHGAVAMFDDYTMQTEITKLVRKGTWKVLDRIKGRVTLRSTLAKFDVDEFWPRLSASGVR
jgi:hypothetical protein